MPIFKKSFILLMLIIFLIAIWTYYGIDNNSEVEEETVTAQMVDDESSQNGNYAVYVCGAVKNPGVVLLTPSSRIMDAVNRCGGLLPNADAEKINLAQGIKDGMQITVPEKSESTQRRTDGVPETASDGRVNINNADIDELTKIPGVGKATAQRIVDYRTQNGGFSAIEDLMKIKGIGKAKFEKMAPKVTI